MGKSEKSLWDLAIEINNANDGENTNIEKSVLVFGSRRSGKSTLIGKFLEKDEIPKPTVALEYTFGRKSKGSNTVKDVGHIWELGGGTWLSRLLDVPINSDTLRNLSLVLMVDLSKPEELWSTIEVLIKQARARVSEIVKLLQTENPAVKDELQNRMWSRVGSNNSDRHGIKPFLIPLTIVGGKYDIFEKFESESRKIICKTLRFLTHINGAQLQFFSVKHKSTVSECRKAISHMLFGTTESKSVQFDVNHPLLIPFGQDSFENIGNPPLSSSEVGSHIDRSDFELWKRAFTSHFPQERQSDPTSGIDPAHDPQYAEHTIDDLRKQKDEELERYRRISERQAREAAQKSLLEAS